MEVMCSLLSVYRIRRRRVVCLTAGRIIWALANQLSTNLTGNLRKTFSRPHISLPFHFFVLEWAMDYFTQWDILLSITVIIYFDAQIASRLPSESLAFWLLCVLEHPHDPLSTFFVVQVRSFRGTCVVLPIGINFISKKPWFPSVANGISKPRSYFSGIMKSILY